ncbi:hypothetical protein LB543_22365 [Mesorhizobium sp. ESP7-2]|uniref:DnaT-like ssDNA-binding protein n=1 Tax=unclassified Mesorhizobium TaxID=325217 RepID=UPI001CCF381C|nr:MULTISPECIES: DnaT-like ssDNA-binding protein [unclassified Mesorhizobium]MBZ9673129.1 hypothetical protein [Mesorhizobium sp. ES1-3]MBZ9709469.1 hypothetical protein [Mesorhizobium sp. ESP7-2]
MANKKWDNSLPSVAVAAWESATESERKEALAHATEFLDTLPFKGKRVTKSQSLSWPRKGVYRDDGSPIRGIPDEIKRVTVLVAGFILAKVPFDTPAVAWIFHDIGQLLKDEIPLGDGDIGWH